MKKNNQIENMNKLMEILEGTNKKLTFANLKASSSGMSRTFNIYIIKNGEMIDVTKLVANITENTYTNQGKMRICGCGMDMLFETCYELNCSCRRLKGEKYDHDFAYNGIVSTYYNLI